MDEFESISHTKWECKYHVVFILKFRRKALYGQLRDHLATGCGFCGFFGRQEQRAEQAFDVSQC